MIIQAAKVLEILDIPGKIIFPETEIHTISIDSRSLQNNSGTLFFALKGINHDGHNYIKELLNKGVQNFVVTHIPLGLVNKANFFIVTNTLKALQDFAGYYRKQFNFPVIAITGSNGKTIVKEWLNFLLSPDYTIVRSPKSYNSQVGVPLSVAAINEKHNLGIFEAGISTVNEMENLAGIINPSIGVLTNIGITHNEGFDNPEQKINEKVKLFKNAEVVILQKNKTVEDILYKRGIKTFTWSYNHEDSDVVIINKAQSTGTTIIKVNIGEAIFNIEIPFIDTFSIENAISCLMVMLYLKYSPETIEQRLRELYPVEIRLQVKNGVNNCTLIDDSYSSDYQSLKIALDFLEQHKANTKKTVILSDIFQSGFEVEDLYKNVTRLLINNKIQRVIGIGETIKAQMQHFPGFSGYATTQDFLQHYSSSAFNNETILIKGARSFRFQEIIALLEEQTHETVLEINLNAVVHNLNFYKSIINPDLKLMVMVKAFGYGSGSFEIAKEIAHHKVDYLGVAVADEGIALRNTGITTPVIVMNPEQSAFPAMTAYNLEPEIYSLKELRAFINVAREKNLSDYPVHIKLDTGMHRLGFEQKDLEELITLLKNNNLIKVSSIFSHLAASDDPVFKDFTLNQIDKFSKWSSYIMQTLEIKPIRHILNTSGIYNFPQAQFDMVRLGIGLYGIGNNKNEQKHLENVGTLKTVILQIKEIEEGESVGYGRRFIVNTKTRTATLPIGYADGIPRDWGNEKGHVLINGKNAPIIGNICMDMLMVNITDIDCKEGDEAIIFGKNLSVSEIATKLNTIPYEILTGISHRVKRVFYKE